MIFHKENVVEPVFLWLDYNKFKIHVIDRIGSETLRKRGSGIRYKVQFHEEDCDDNTVWTSYLFRIGDIWYLAGRYDIIPDIQTRHIGHNYSGKEIIDNRYDNPHKAAVDVAAVCYKNGKVKPYGFLWDDGTEYSIDDATEPERAVSLKAGIIGLKYKIQVLGKETNLYRDDDLWFMERKGNYRVLDVHGRPID